MHGGFENETPNIPTNSIIKLDLIAHIKGNQQLLQKIENVYQNQARNANGGTPNRAGGDAANGASRSSTPPMQSLGKQKMKIQIGKGEIE